MSIASIIEQQIPSFIKDEDVKFTEFLDSYYRFLSESYSVSIEDLNYTSIGLLQNETVDSLNSERGEIYHHLTSIKKLRDIDTTTVGLVSNFVSEYMDGVNAPTLDSIRSNMKLMKNFYENKGNENSFHFLFNLLYDEIVTVSYPYDKVLKVSEAVWIDRVFVRIDSDLISTDILDKALSTKIGNGILRNYFDDTVVSKDKTYMKKYYKLEISDVEGEFTASSITFLPDTDDEQTCALMSGISDIQIWTGSEEPTNVYPSDIISINPNDNATAGTQYGAIVEIESLKKNKLDDNGVTVTLVGSGTGKVNLVHDYYSIYEYDLNDGVTIDSATAMGIKSGATGDIVILDGNKLWMENFTGTFLSDYQLNESGASELITLTKGGNEIGSLRLERKYTACTYPATIVVQDSSVNIINPGIDYIFTPYVKDNIVSISGLGKFDRDDAGNTIGIKVSKMGLGYAGELDASPPTTTQPYNQEYDIKLNSTTKIGYGKIGFIGTEQYVESSINTLDGEAKLRDSNYYQEFSYEILSNVSMDVWKYPIKKLIHPAGMKVFGKDVVVSAPFDLSLTDQFPSWFTDQLVISLSTPASFSMSYEVDTGNIDSSVFSSVVENSSSLVSTFSTEQNNISEYITRYGDDISKLFFIENSISFDAGSDGTSIRSSSNIQYHTEEFSDTPNADVEYNNEFSPNALIHMSNYGASLNGKTVSVETMSGRTVLSHSLSVDAELEGSGIESGSKGQINNTIFTVNEDDPVSDFTGDSIIKGLPHSNFFEIDKDSTIGSSSNGVGMGGDNTYKFFLDESSGSPEASGEALVKPAKISKKYDYHYYSSL